MALHKMNDGCVERALNEIRYADQIRKESVYTGYSTLDELLGGMMPGEIYLIGARPQMGKSTFIFNLLRRMCIENGIPAMLFSPEASAEFIIHELIYSVSDYCGEKGSIGALKSYEQAADAIKSAPFLIADTFDLTVDGFIRQCRMAKKDNPVRIVFLDSWDGIHFFSKPDREEIIESFKKIKSLACELGLTIVISMNLDEAIEEEYRGSHIPMIYDFMIPEEAMDKIAGVMALYRRSYYSIKIIKDQYAYERTFKDDLNVRVLRSRVSNCFGVFFVFSLYNKRLDQGCYFETDSDAWYFEARDDEELEEMELSDYETDMYE